MHPFSRAPFAVRRSRLLLIAVLLLLPVGAMACAALVPGYAAERARLEADASAARDARKAAAA